MGKPVSLDSTATFSWNQVPSSYSPSCYLQQASLFTVVLLGCNGCRAVVPYICSALLTKQQLAAEQHSYMT